MVLSLKTWKSRSLPVLLRTNNLITMIRIKRTAAPQRAAVLYFRLSVERSAAGNAGGFFYFFFACRADHSAAMRRRKAFGFSANSRPAKRAAVFKCAARRASIIGVSRDRHGAKG